MNIIIYGSIIIGALLMVFFLIGYLLIMILSRPSMIRFSIDRHQISGKIRIVAHLVGTQRGEPCRRERIRS